MKTNNAPQKAEVVQLSEKISREQLKIEAGKPLYLVRYE